MKFSKAEDRNFLSVLRFKRKRCLNKASLKYIFWSHPVTVETTFKTTFLKRRICNDLYHGMEESINYVILRGFISCNTSVFFVVCSLCLISIFLVAWKLKMSIHICIADSRGIPCKHFGLASRGSVNSQIRAKVLCVW